MMNRFQKVRAWGFLALKGWWQRMTIGTRVMLIDGDKVLLIRHGYVPGWQFPGGGVGPGETMEAAAAREVMEETGYRITGPLELHGIYHQNNAVTNRDHVVFYLARQFEKVRDHKPNREIAEVAWFERTRLPEMVTPATSQRVDEVFDGTPRRTEWGY